MERVTLGIGEEAVRQMVNPTVGVRVTPEQLVRHGRFSMAEGTMSLIPRLLDATEEVWRSFHARFARLNVRKLMLAFSAGATAR